MFKVCFLKNEIINEEALFHLFSHTEQSLANHPPLSPLKSAINSILALDKLSNSIFSKTERRMEKFSFFFSQIESDLFLHCPRLYNNFGNTSSQLTNPPPKLVLDVDAPLVHPTKLPPFFHDTLLFLTPRQQVSPSHGGSFSLTAAISRESLLAPSLAPLEATGRDKGRPKRKQNIPVVS